MLPGFRFLFAATFLTLSILVFGLGAAALLRAAHEQFATNPSWHAAPDATFVQQSEPARPQLAMLRVGTPAPQQKTVDDTPGADDPAGPAPAEQSAAVQPPAEPAQIAALKQDAPTLPAAATSDLPAPQSADSTGPAAAAPAEAPASGAAQQAATPAAGDFYRLFLVPGMQHCGGGPGPTKFDMVSALEDWVERGKPPERITASHLTTTGQVDRTRPLCPYPQEAQWNGNGSTDQAENFVCGIPKP